MGLVAQLPDNKIVEILNDSPDLVDPFRSYCESNSVSKSILALIPTEKK
jgi:hypothetical protein